MLGDLLHPEDIPVPPIINGDVERSVTIYYCDEDLCNNTSSTIISTSFFIFSIIVSSINCY